MPNGQSCSICRTRGDSCDCYEPSSSILDWNAIYDKACQTSPVEEIRPKKLWKEEEEKQGRKKEIRRTIKTKKLWKEEEEKQGGKSGMRRTIKTTKTYILHLNEDEAEWLKALVRNPSGNPDEEEERDSEMRQAFWNALS